MASKDQYGHPRIPHRGHYDSKRCDSRRAWVERFCNCDLSSVGEWWSRDTRKGSSDKAVSTEILKGNIENPIGLAKIPIGIVGPLLIHGDHIQGYAMCPFATTEGALVASATRGAALLTRAGGVTCKVLHKRIGRSLAIMCDSLHEANKLQQWVEANIELLQSKVQEYSQHTRLTGVTCYTMGALIHILLLFDTGDAAGQNMISNAAWICCKYIKTISLAELGVTIKHSYMASMADGEKSISSFNLLTTRGINVVAEAWLPDSVIRSTFKTSADELYRLYRYMLYGSVRTGRVGFNVNASNTLAAVFTATGQDIAALLESASACFVMEPASTKDILKHCGCENEEGLYVSYELTSLLIGTVGGGTSLPTQKECLQLMGCYGRGGVYRLAEIIAGVCLSLDLSTAAAVSNDTFVSSHEKLGKNKPSNGLMPAQLNDYFFKTILGSRGELLDKTQFKIDTQNSIISDITANEVVKLVGHFGFNISYKDKSGTIQNLKVVIKSKPTDTEIMNMVNRLVQGCGFALAASYEANKGNTGFRHCSEREVTIAASLSTNPVLQKIHPKVYHTVNNIEKDVYLIIMELLHTDHGFSLFNTVHDISIWTEADIKVVLRDLAQLHASYMSDEFNHVLSSNWIEEMGGAKMAAMADVWTGLLDHAVLEFPQFWSTKWASIIRSVIPKIKGLWAPLDSFDKTLVHNDCNPRNMCLRLPDHAHVGAGGVTVPYQDPRTLCMYDWELSRVDVPQHDVVEFLAFILSPEVGVAKRKEYIEFYRLHLEHYAGRSFPASRFMAVYNVACLDFAVNRLLMYTMVHTYKDYAFLPRVVTSHMQYLQHEVDNGTISIPTLDSKL